MAAVELGADLLVAQGIEAGGQVRGKIGLMALLGEVLGAIEAMSLWAGESVGGVTRVQPASEIVRELADEAERLLDRSDSVVRANPGKSGG